MKAAGILDFATALHHPDFAKMAEAAGILGLKSETPGRVRPLLVDALSSGVLITDIEHPIREKFGKDRRLVLQTGVGC